MATSLLQCAKPATPSRPPAASRPALHCSLISRSPGPCNRKPIYQLDRRSFSYTVVRCLETKRGAVATTEWISAELAKGYNYHHHLYDRVLDASDLNELLEVLSPITAPDVAPANTSSPTQPNSTPASTELLQFRAVRWTIEMLLQHRFDPDPQLAHDALFPDLHCAVRMLTRQLIALLHVNILIEYVKDEDLRPHGILWNGAGAWRIDNWGDLQKCMLWLWWLWLVELDPASPDIHTYIPPIKWEIGAATQVARPGSFGDQILGNHPDPDPDLIRLLDAFDAWCGRISDLASEKFRNVHMVECLCAYTGMLRLAKQEGNVMHAPTMELLCELMCTSVANRELQRLKMVGGGFDDLYPRQLANLITALADTEYRSSTVARLSEVVAHEVYRQISNRHTQQEYFLPNDLIKILNGYTRLPHKDAKVSRMLDAIAGYTVKRIRVADDSAVRSPEDVAAILHGFADLEHFSVAIPELVGATAQQLTKEVVKAGLPNESTSDTQGLQAPLTFSPDHILSVLTGYRRLGYYPGDTLLTCLMVPISQQIDQASSDTLSGLLGVISDLKQPPGPVICHGICTAIHNRWKQGQATAMHMGTALIASTNLNHAPYPEMVEDTCRACLYHMCGDDDSDDDDDRRGGVVLESAPAPHMACGLLSALVVCDGVTIRRLGLACMALRQSGVSASKVDKAILAVAGAAVMLGEEGWEMVEEVLSESMAASAHQELCDMVDRLRDTVMSDLNDFNTVVEEVMTSMGCVDTSSATMQVLGKQPPLSVYDVTPLLAHPHMPTTHATSTASQAQTVPITGPLLMALEPVQGEDISPSGTALLGAATFRRKVVERLWQDVVHSGDGGVDGTRVLLVQVPWGLIRRLPKEEQRQRLGRLVRAAAVLA